MKRLLVVVVSLAVLIGCASSAAAGDLENKLIQAVKTRNADVVRALLDQGASVNAKDKNGTTALDSAAIKGKVDVVRLLLDRGADVSAKNNFGWTPLICAVMFGKVDIARLLLDKGAGVNAKDNNGFTALRWAAREGHADIARLLLNKGADVNAKDRYGNTALYWANAHGKTDVAKILKDAEGTATSAAAGKKDVVRVVASPSAAKAPDGFIGIRWGANREQIIKAMHERGFTTKGTILPGRGHHLPLCCSEATSAALIASCNFI
jgi:ankyrin repeat protein